jgi:hypothetical protein
VRRRLASAPPDHLTDPAGGSGPGATGASPARRTRIKLAVATLPMLLAVVLGAVYGLSGPDPADTAPGSTSAPSQTSPSLAPQAANRPGGLGPAPSDEGAGVSGPAGSTDPTGPSDPTGPTVQAGTGWHGVGWSGPTVGGTAVDDAPVPAAPAGHRPVAIRFASPDAVALVGAGDRVDLVGLDGSVLASGLHILQDRSSAQAPVLVLSVPRDEAPAVAAAAATRDLTVLVAPPDPQPR